MSRGIVPCMLSIEEGEDFDCAMREGVGVRRSGDPEYHRDGAGGYPPMGMVEMLWDTAEQLIESHRAQFKSGVPVEVEDVVNSVRSMETRLGVLCRLMSSWMRE